MSKISLDKYYTPPAIAKQCIEWVYLNCFPISEIIEPSAGNGSFSLLLPNCIAYDIEPHHESIIKADFFDVKIDFLPGRLVVGNPPFGPRNTKSVQFFKHSIKFSDWIAFVQPISQYRNSQQMYEFDLIFSERLPAVMYSGVKLECCFNIWKRPVCGLVNNKRISYKIKEVSVNQWRRGGSYKIQDRYDFGICGYGAVGKKIDYQGQYCQEYYITINDALIKEGLLEILELTDFKSLSASISTPKIEQWRIEKYIKEILYGQDRHHLYSDA